ncbi:MAG TPA: SAM-dependent chlorinase/fluorinase, partial [Opitutus sp.]|nr:SAM-dependent chlorinase/fluorinase [Opitutus sp.]
MRRVTQSAAEVGRGGACLQMILGADRGRAASIACKQAPAFCWRKWMGSLGAVLVMTFAAGAEQALVLQTDFGTKDGAVAAMKGVAVGVNPRLAIFDLSHENTPFDVWEAAYRLKQAAPFWPAGTVFVSVIDPGVGTPRKSVVLQTKSGHFF